MRKFIYAILTLFSILSETLQAEDLVWPTTHPQDAVYAQLRKGYGDGADVYDAYFWWQDNYLWQEVIPITKSPFICGGDLKQNGVDKYYFLRTSFGSLESSYHCGDLSERKIFYISTGVDSGLYSYFDTYIIHDGFSSAYDASIYIPSSTEPPYTPPIDTYKLNLTVSGSGRITGPLYNCDANKTCSYAVEKGTYVGINGIPDEGYNLLEWSGQCKGTNQYCFFKMDGDKDATVKFKAIPKEVDPWIAPEDLTPYEHSGIQKELTVTKVGLGIVRSQSDWIYCGDRCNDTFNKGQRVVLTATPAPGWILKKWNGACTGSKLVCSVKLNQRKKVKAVFIENPLNNLPGCGDICNCARNLAPILGPGIVPIGCR